MYFGFIFSEKINDETENRKKKKETIFSQI